MPFLGIIFKIPTAMPVTGGVLLVGVLASQKFLLCTVVSAKYSLQTLQNLIQNIVIVWRDDLGSIAPVHLVAVVIARVVGRGHHDTGRST